MCKMNDSSSFFHIMWEKPSSFWDVVALKSPQLLAVTVHTTIFVFLLDDLSVLGVMKEQRKIMLAGLTAAKKIIFD